MPIYGYRARIGYTSPPINTEVFPYEFYKMAPPGVTLVLTTMMVARHTVDSGEAQESWDHAMRAVKEFARAGVNIIVLGGGPVVYSGGVKRAEDTMEALTKELGVPVTDSSTAYREAARVLGTKVQGSVGYASPPGAADHLPSGGRTDPDDIRTVGNKYGSIPFVEVGKVPSEVPLEMARELKREHPEIDTIRLGSPHWACGAIIDQVEKELGVSVIQGSQAILWWALRSLGIKDKIGGYGRLLREL